MAEEQTSFTLATINADHTNRHPDVNTVNSLVEKLEDVTLNDLSANIVTVQEMGAKSSKALADTLAESGYYTIRRKPAYDYLTLSYQTDQWSLDTVYDSKPGKYVALKLINEYDNSEALVVATHQPYKRRNAVAEAERLTLKLLDDVRDTDGFDFAVVLGDMNKEPDVVQRWLPDFNRVITNNSPKTTKSGGRKDNILYDDSLEEESGHVWHYPQFSHRPVVATLNFLD